MPAGDIRELQVVTQVQGQRCVNVHHYYQFGANGTAGTGSEALVNYWVTTMVPLMKACISNTGTIIEVECRKMFPPPIEDIYELDVSIAGTFSADAYPSEVSRIIQKKNTSGGRWMRGRVYLPAVPEDTIDRDTGLFNDAVYNTACLAFADQLVHDVAAGSGWAFYYGLYSQGPHGPFNKTDMSYVSNVPRCQRRRQPGRGT